LYEGLKGLFAVEETGDLILGDSLELFVEPRWLMGVLRLIYTEGSI